MADASSPPPPSQASSHFRLDPVQASVLYEAEARRRRGLRQKGTLRTGCAEVDGGVLLGGFERGCVVGISAEEEEFAVLVSLLFSSPLSPFPRPPVPGPRSLGAVV